MVKEIITYPTPPSVEYATDVRVFDENLLSLVEDIKDTIIENNLDGLSAYQIGSYYNVVVVKNVNSDDSQESFLELINPRVITANGKITTEESTSYFPGLSSEINRYDKISLVYQDLQGNQHSLKAEEEFSVLLQRKIDYTFGANFLTKMTKEQKALFEKKLEFGSNIAISEICPTTFKRDYILKASKTLTIAMIILLLTSLFISDNETLLTMWNYQIYLFAGVLGLDVAYFFYAHYEAKQYTSCISCQSGNIIGTVLISFVKLILIMLTSYFLINPV